MDTIHPKNHTLHAHYKESDLRKVLPESKYFSEEEQIILHAVLSKYRLLSYGALDT